MTLSKAEFLKKQAAAMKKELLQESNCCVNIVTLMKSEGVAFPKIKLS